MKKLGVVGLVLAIFLMACSSTEADWQKASTANTVAAFQDFLKEHPNGQHADEARTRIHSLEDNEAWISAMNTNTETGFQQYVKAEPDGAHVAGAQNKITGFERAAAWQTASANGSADALKAFLDKYPQGPESDEARAQLQKLTSGYQVQLPGAFRSARTAERASARLKTRFGNILHDVVVVAPTPPSKLHRLRSAPMSREEANAACAKLRRAHESCKVVKA
ncbi:MAG: SPOR domain-containing protein [Steroidobacteraceae bacterium]